MRTTAQAVKVNFRFTEGLRKRLDSLSLKMDVPISDVVRKAVESYDPDNISIKPGDEDRARIAAFCESLGCSPNFLLRCAMMEYLDNIDKHGFRTSILVAPGQKKEFVYPPKPGPEQAVAETEEKPATPPPRPASYGPKKTPNPKKK